MLEVTQTEAYFSYCAANPDVKISQRKFEYLKPFFIRSARERDRRSCLCRKHEEIKMVFSDCMKVRKNIIKTSNCDAVAVPSSVSDVVKQTMCAKPEGSEFHKLDCITRKCKDCGTKLLQLLPGEQLLEGTVKWKRYDYVARGKETATGDPQEKLALL